MLCVNCGRENDNNSQFCTSCGAKLIDVYNLKGNSGTATEEVVNPEIKEFREVKDISDKASLKGTTKITEVNDDISVKEPIDPIDPVKDNGSAQAKDIRGNDIPRGNDNPRESDNLRGIPESYKGRSVKKDDNTGIILMVAILGVLFVITIFVIIALKKGINKGVDMAGDYVNSITDDSGSDDPSDLINPEDITVEITPPTGDLPEAVTEAETEEYINDGAAEPEDSATEEPVQEYPAVDEDNFYNITASSVLEEASNGSTYYAENANDGLIDTAWSEASKGNGVGETLTILLDRECLVKGMYFWNGYQKSEELFYKNNRLSEMKVTFSDGSSEIISLTDGLGKDVIEFSETHVTDRVVITIMDVYEGNKYNDTLITDLELF